MPRVRFCERPNCSTQIPIDRKVCDRCKVPPDAANYERKSWQLWYRKPRWRKASKQFLHDNPFCAECKRNGKVSRSTQTDHIVPHNGDSGKFWNYANWQALCAPCHSRKTRDENRKAPSVYDKFAESKKAVGGDDEV